MQPFRSFAQLVFFCFILSALIVYELRDALSSYFTSDDLTHISYAFRVHNQPSLIWSVFSTVWTQDNSSESFYRPITELSFILDYQLSRAQPFGYHISNFIYSAIAGIAIFLFVERMCQKFSLEKARLISICSAISFVVSPLHGEVTSWIIGRVDGISTMFYLISLALFVRIPSEKKVYEDWLGCLSLIAFALGFLSKEMAATLPIAIWFFQFYSLENANLQQRLKRATVIALPYLLVLAALLLVRSGVTGSLLGGYSGAASQAIGSSISETIAKLVNLWKVAFPFNEELMPKGGAIEGLFRLYFFFLGLLLLMRSRFDTLLGAHLRCLGFLASWFVLQLAPLYQVFMLNPSLAGNRLFYLSTAVISIILSILIVPQNFRLKGIFAQAASFYAAFVFCLLVALSVVVGKKNNECWLLAGERTVEIKNQIQSLVQSLPAGKKLLIAYIPHQIAGGHMFYSYYLLRALLSPPLSLPQIAERVVVLEPRLFTAHAFLPSGILRQKLSSPARYTVAYWDERQRRLVNFVLDSGPGAKMFARDLDLVPSVATGELKLTAKEPINTKEVRWVDLDIEVLKCSTAKKRKSLLLKFEDRAKLLMHTASHVSGDYDPSLARQTVKFPVDENPSWLFMRQANSFSIYLGAKPEIRICRARLDDGATTIPSFFVRPETLRECADGVYRAENYPLKVNFDVTRIPGAAGCICEISRPYMMFQLENLRYRDSDLSAQSMKRWTTLGTSGEIELQREFFPSKTCCQVRIFAIKADGRIVGTCSDPVYIGIDDRPKGQEL